MLTRRSFVAGLFAAAATQPLFSAATTFPGGNGDDLKKMHLFPNPENVNSAQAMGEYGVLSIRSRDRLDRVLRNWLKFGVIKSDSPFDNINWARQSVIGVLDCGDVGNEVLLGAWNGGANQTSLDFFLGYIVYKQRGKVENKPKLLLVVNPAPAAKVAVKTWTPKNGGDHDTRQKSLVEWEGVVGPDTGDSVGGLEGRITAAAAKIKAGEDIRLEFKLQLSESDKKRGAFSRRAESVLVWDGKYSNGYRNHAFHVVKPDGTIEILRPKEIKAWDKNAPHEVEIAANKPYVLPNWAEGKNFKSLKDLGLKTEPGTYSITGIYTEVVDEPKPDRMRRLIPATWGGELWTNTVTVEVEK